MRSVLLCFGGGRGVGGRRGRGGGLLRTALHLEKQRNELAVVAVKLQKLYERISSLRVILECGK